MTEQYVKDYFDEMADGWEQRYTQSRFFRMRYKEFEKLINEFITARSVVLDYGCGSGVLIDLLAQKAKLIIGTDVSKKMRTVAREKFVFFENVKIWKPKRLEKKSFDLVICSSVIEYVEVDSIFLKDICTYLKPGGIIIITFPNQIGLLQNLNKHVISKIKKKSYIEYQKNIYTIRSVKNLLSTSGMETLKLYSAIGLPILSELGMGELLFYVGKNNCKLF